MKTTLQLVLISFLAGTAFSQKRYHVPSTHISVVIPAGVETSKHYCTITKPDVFEMTVAEFPVDFDSKFGDIDSVNYSKRGALVYEESEMFVNGYKGKLLHIYSNAEADAVQLIFGDSASSIMVSTLYDKKNRQVYEQVLEMYRSILVDKKKEIDWNDFLAFDYDKKSTLKLVKGQLSSMGMVFRKNGIQDTTTSFMMVQQYPNVGMFGNVESFMSQILMASIFQTYEIKELIFEGKKEINGKTTYIFNAHCLNHQKEKCQVYCIGRLTDELGVIVSSIISNEEDVQIVEQFYQGMSFKE